MSIANSLWGAPRIHGELLKLGIDIGQTSVAKYMAKRRDPPSQGWRTFLRNHADGIAAMDLFVVPTISFRLLYGLLIVGHGRRQILWFGVTAHPTAEWIANQITEACGWEQAPRYLIRDRDGAYGEVFIRRLRSMGIRDRPTSPRSPWQNGYAERLIGSIRRECLDHVVVFSERHLRHLLLFVYEILQWGPHASIPGEGCTLLARRRSRRAHSLSPNPGRAASPICPDLICDRFRHAHRLANESAIAEWFQLAGDAVLIAPVSRLNSLQTGNFTGNFVILVSQTPISLHETTVLPGLFEQFPTQANRENISMNRESLAVNREISSAKCKVRTDRASTDYLATRVAGLADRPSLLLRVRVTTADRAAADRQQRHFALSLKHESRMGLIQRASGRRCQARPTPSPLGRGERGPCARGQRRWRQRSGLSGTAKHR